MVAVAGLQQRTGKRLPSACTLPLCLSAWSVGKVAGGILVYPSHLHPSTFSNLGRRSSDKGTGAQCTVQEPGACLSRSAGA